MGYREPEEGFSPDNIKVPPPGDNYSTPKVSRLLALPGHPFLHNAPAEVPPVPLTLAPQAEREVETWLMRGDLVEVQERAQAVLDEAPSEDKTRWAVSALARAKLLEGDLDGARALIADTPEDQHLIVRALVALAEGRVPLARTLIDSALKERPEGLVETYAVALVIVAEGDSMKAQMRLQEVCQAEPEHAVARHQLGQILAGAGDVARAGTLFEQAIVIAPAFMPPALSLAEMFVEARQYIEAMAVLNEVAEARPELLAPRLLQLKVLLGIGELTAAKELADALGRAAPGHPEVEILRAEVHFQSGDPGEAERVLAALSQSGPPEVRVRALQKLASLCASASPPDFERALKNLEEAHKAAPADTGVLLEILELTLATGVQDRATEVIEHLQALTTADLSTLLNAAVLTQNHGRNDVAKSFAERAIDIVRGTPSEEQIRSFISQMN